MPWRFPDKIPKVAKNWTEDQKKRCIKAGNSVLKRGGTDAEAIRACIAAAGKSSRQKKSSLTAAQSTRPLSLTPLPFAAAIEASRRRKVVLPEVYYGELQGLARTLAFTVSRLSTLDQIDRVLKSLNRSLEEGNTFADFKKAVEANPDVASLPRGRVETIFRNGVQTAYARGRAEHHVRHKNTRPFLRYSAINDSRVRPSHAAMDGTILPVDHPWFRTHYPPNGHNCFVPGTRVSGNFKRGLKAWYSGPMVELETTRGYRLTVTANHPILTDKGWILAHKLNKGDTAFTNQFKIESFDSSPVNDQYGAARIENVFETLSTHRRSAAHIAALDFYGDGRFMEGNVDVVGFEIELVKGLISSGLQSNSEFSFFNRDFTSSLIETLATLLDIDQWLSKSRRALFSNSLIESFRPIFPILPFGFFGLGLRSSGNAFAFQDSSNDFFASIKGCRDLNTALSTQIKPDNFLSRRNRGAISSLAPQCCIGLASQWYVSALEKAKDGDLSHAKFLRELMRASTGQIAPDKIVRISNFDFSGHVYDLESDYGWILSEGIVTSNCRCSVISLTLEEAERRGITIEPPVVSPDNGWNHSVMDDPALGVIEAAANKRMRINPALAPLVLESIPRRLTLDEISTQGREMAERLHQRLPELAAGGIQGSLALLNAYQEVIAKELEAAGRSTAKVASIKGRGKGRDLVREASSRFPDTWTSRADELGDLRVKARRGRAWQFTLSPDIPSARVALDPPFGQVEASGGAGFIVADTLNTAVHEYAHRLQAALPELDDYFQELHARRTAGDTLESLRALTGRNYRPEEMTRKDKYVNEYMGKEYRPDPYMYTGRTGALEVMSMAFEAVLGLNPMAFYALRRDDPELFELTLGVLFHYDP